MCLAIHRTSSILNGDRLRHFDDSLWHYCNLVHQLLESLSSDMACCPFCFFFRCPLSTTDPAPLSPIILFHFSANHTLPLSSNHTPIFLQSHSSIFPPIILFYFHQSFSSIFPQSPLRHGHGACAVRRLIMAHKPAHDGNRTQVTRLTSHYAELTEPV